MYERGRTKSYESDPDVSQIDMLMTAPVVFKADDAKDDEDSVDDNDEWIFGRWDDMTSGDDEEDDPTAALKGYLSKQVGTYICQMVWWGIIKRNGHANY